MKELFKNIKEDRFTFRGYLVSLTIIIVSILYVLFFFSKLPPFLPIFNQLPWGVERLTQTLGIFIPSLITSFILILNLICSGLVYKNSPLIARILTVISILVSLLAFLFIIRTIQIIL